jgi:adenosylcobyric acid synthase
VVLGRPWATLDAAGYQEAKEELWPVVWEQLEQLRSRYDAVICEGAGSPAEINLLERDITNLRVAGAAGFPAVVVGDIDRGGVFAALYGTVALLPAEQAQRIQGFLINKFRGDPALLTSGLAELERRTGVPTLGVLPWLGRLGIDPEDSLQLRDYPPASGPPRERGAGALDVAAVQLPHISNFTDLDALGLEPGVSLRLVQRRSELGRPALVVLPGTKSTVADLAWLEESGLAEAVADLAAGGSTTVLGICGGYQMLGRVIEDSVEAAVPARVRGLGLLDVSTRFHADKITRRVRGHALSQDIDGYEIHHGRTEPAGPWIQLETGDEGSRSPDGAVYGTSVHGLFECDGFRRAFLTMVAARAGRRWEAGPQWSFAAARSAQFDRLADALEAHVDTEAILGMIKEAAS